MIAPNISSPVLRDLFHRTAKLRLHFLVLGANVAGLACAYHLKQAGHDVTVIEPRALALENVRSLDLNSIHAAHSIYAL